jgi:hypothetical protein
MNHWPVRFILDGPDWRRGYDAATAQSLDRPARSLVNPFDPDQDEFYGFESGRDDAEKVERLTATA